MKRKRKRVIILSKVRKLINNKVIFQKMTSQSMTIGFQKEWKVFFHNHPLWPAKYKLLTSTLNKVFIRKVITDNPADRIVFYMGRLCVEDFNEIFLLCGNGYGIGGLKILRGLYERAVTLGYIAKNPEQADSFLNYHHIHKNKMINHAGKIFDLEETIGAEELDEVKENYRKYKDEFEVDVCKKCGTKRIMLSWSKLDTASMAKKAELEGLYFPGFYYPTLQTHATPTSLMARMKANEDGSTSFDESSQHEWASKALIAAHNIMIYIIMVQNTYFNLNIDSEIEDRKNDFQEMWSEQNSP